MLIESQGLTDSKNAVTTAVSPTMFTERFFSSAQVIAFFRVRMDASSSSFVVICILPFPQSKNHEM